MNIGEGPSQGALVETMKLGLRRVCRVLMKLSCLGRKKAKTEKRPCFTDDNGQNTNTEKITPAQPAELYGPRQDVPEMKGWLTTHDNVIDDMPSSEDGERDFDSKMNQLASQIYGTPETVTPPLHVEGATLLHTLPVSCGGFSDVYQASWNGKEVALKRLRVPKKGHERQKIHQIFVKEALRWHPLSHPYVVPFLGIETNIFSPFICLVTPWMQHGTLVDFISKHHPSETDANKFLLEVSLGLTYIHSKEIVHGGICGRNILIDDEGHARLADSGLHAIADAAIAPYASNHQSSPRWMAPELLDPELFGLTSRQTYASDVYAFACVCIEVYTGQPPFQDIARDFSVMVGVLENARPKRPSGETGIGMTDNMWVLVERCWTREPAERPPISAAVEVLEGLSS